MTLSSIPKAHPNRHPPARPRLRPHKAPAQRAIASLSALAGGTGSSPSLDCRPDSRSPQSWPSGSVPWGFGAAYFFWSGKGKADDADECASAAHGLCQKSNVPVSTAARSVIPALEDEERVRARVRVVFVAGGVGIAAGVPVDLSG